MRNVALDLGARKISYCEVREGQVVARRTVRSLSELERELGAETERARVAFEASREAWHVHDWLSERGHEALVVDTTRSKQLGIGQHGRKTDRIDAEVLALALERGGIPLAHVLSPARRDLRKLLCVRRELVETRARYVAQMREIVRSEGGHVPSCAVEDFVTKVTEVELGQETRMLIEPLGAMLVPLSAQIARLEERLLSSCGAEPAFAVLTTAVAPVAPAVSAVLAS